MDDNQADRNQADRNYEADAHTGQRDCPPCMAELIASIERAFPEAFEGEQAEGVAAIVQAWLETIREISAQAIIDPELNPGATLDEWLGTLFNALLIDERIKAARDRMYAKHSDRYIVGIDVKSD